METSATNFIAWACKWECVCLETMSLKQNKWAEVLLREKKWGINLSAVEKSETGNDGKDEIIKYSFGCLLIDSHYFLFSSEKPIPTLSLKNSNSSDKNSFNLRKCFFWSSLHCSRIQRSFDFSAIAGWSKRQEEWRCEMKKIKLR
jgi:hypothetical protein